MDHVKSLMVDFGWARRENLAMYVVLTEARSVPNRALICDCDGETSSGVKRELGL